MSEFPHRTAALPVTQPFGTFYVAVLPADLLREVAYADAARVSDVNAESYRISGTQRAQRLERLKEIGKFIDTVEAVFPTSIVIAANYRADGELEEESARWMIEGHELVIPSRQRLASVVDGQHRLWGFDKATVSDREQMPLVCSVFLDLPNPFQAYVFATVNFNQKKVDRSLAYELFGFDVEEESADAWTPEKTAVFLTRRLNVDDDSPLRGRITVAPQDSELLTLNGSLWRVSTATVVDGLLRLFSRDPKSDRNTMFMVPREERSRTRLPDDKTPARDLYRATNDKAIYTLVRNFLGAANTTLWQPAKPKSYIIRTVGVQALFDILAMIARDTITAKDLTEASFKKLLAKASTVDFADNFFQASGHGRVRIKHMLALTLDLEDIDEVPEADRPQYEALAAS